jgi:GNAT superfamily N-acetyltransferase
VRRASVAIRSFVAADAEACARIFDRAWHAGHPYAPRTIDAAVLRTETEGEMLFVAEDGEGIAGFVSLYKPQSFVHHLFVDPRCHGRGIGGALLDHAVALAGGTATLKCQLRNEAALGFYRHRGWIEVTAGTGEFGDWVTLRSPG